MVVEEYWGHNHLSWDTNTDKVFWQMIFIVHVNKRITRWSLNNTKMLLFLMCSSLSSFCRSLPIRARKSSNPRRTIVSLHPLSARHEGHVLISISGLLYQVLTHVSHPKIVLQHLVIITGGWIGTWRQIVHWNVSRTTRFRPSGTRLFSESEKMSDKLPLMLPTSWSSVSSLSSFGFFVGNSKSSSESLTCLDLLDNSGVSSPLLLRTA